MELRKTRLNIPTPRLESTYRIGEKGGNKPRPIMMTFTNVPQRNVVWFKKATINKDQEQRLWIQEDLPRELRMEINALLKVYRYAKNLPEVYPDVKIKDFKLRVDGKFYTHTQLEALPVNIRPSTIATPSTEDTVVFFGRDSPLSNHFICSFDIAGTNFTSVEQYLAWSKAKVTPNTNLVTEILNTTDPAEHKRTLNFLKGENTQEWEEKREDAIKTALRAKFGQNAFLKDFLCNTYPKKLGEASPNPVWGIGMSLRDQHVLDQTKWNVEGNLLGKTLTTMREELLQE